MYVPTYLKYVVVLVFLAVLVFFGFKYFKKFISGVVNEQPGTTD